VEKQRFDIRTDPTQRRLAALILPVFVAAYLLQLNTGPVALVAIFAMIAVISGWTPLPATIDSKTNSLRIPGISQRRIPLRSIRDVTLAGTVVRIEWVDGRGSRIRRVWPKDPERFAEWVRWAADEVNQAA